MTFRVGQVLVERAGSALRWTAGLEVDADGCPRAYHPDGSPGLDALQCARDGKGGWCGVVVGPDGAPVVQGPEDPAPGFLVSQTALVNALFPEADPRRYVDAARVPYLAVPPELRAAGVRLGDVARVVYRGKWSPAVVADVSPRGKLGEGSIALARALGIPDSPRHGGVGAGVAVTLWPGSAHGWPRIADDVATQVAGLQAMLEAGLVA